MSSDIKKMDIKEFREFGLLQEINRTFLHPLGLAIEIKINDDGSEELGGVWDYRDDPEGIVFGENMIDPDKIKRVQNLMDEKHKTRKNTLGFLIQE